jgi:hypothetical protein
MKSATMYEYIRPNLQEAISYFENTEGFITVHYKWKVVAATVINFLDLFSLQFQEP